MTDCAAIAIARTCASGRLLTGLLCCCCSRRADKVQGKTLDRFIISAAPRSFKPHMTFTSLYVLLSRVRAVSSLRVLRLPPRSQGGLDYLLEKAPDKATSCYEDAQLVTVKSAE